MFDGKPEKLAYFLNQVWSHMDRYKADYPNDAACVNTTITSLEGEPAHWVVFLHDEGSGVGKH